MKKPTLAVLILGFSILTHADGMEVLNSIEVRKIPEPQTTSSDRSRKVEASPSNAQQQQPGGPSQNRQLYRADNYEIPAETSPIPYRFILTSNFKDGEPVDRLDSIRIGSDQRSVFLYIKLLGVQRGQTYRLRLRALDTKRELVFDGEAPVYTPTNTIIFRARISPRKVTDAPGVWEFQGVLDGRKLFVETREITFL